jgi:CRISPR-associated protein Cmr4
MKTLALFIYTESSLHAGVGSTVSAIDLPIQRERTTQFPIVQGSGIKGALRSQFHNVTNPEEKKMEDAIFGAITKKTVVEDGKEIEIDFSFGGAISVGDARIVLFPVRSLSGVFAYVTCPTILARIRRDIPSFPELMDRPGENKAFAVKENDVNISGSIVLEEFSFKVDAQQSGGVEKIANWLAANAFPSTAEYKYWKEKIKRSLVVLHDDAFRDFVVNGTEVTTHVHLDPATKTVKKGQLWTQEALPADTLLMSNVVIRSVRDGSKKTEETVEDWLVKNVQNRSQIGGDETTGQGMVALKWAKE